MAEIDIGGAKLSGGKLLLIIPLLASLGGALWGGFEVYQRLLNAEEAVENYVSPDMSGINKELAVIREQLVNVGAEQDRLESLTFNIEKLAREVDASSASTQRDIRNDVYSVEKSVVEDIRQLNKDVAAVKKELEYKIQQLLDNPLNNED